MATTASTTAGELEKSTRLVHRSAAPGSVLAHEERHPLHLLHGLGEAPVHVEDDLACPEGRQLAAQLVLAVGGVLAEDVGRAAAHARSRGPGVALHAAEALASL